MSQVVITSEVSALAVLTSPAVAPVTATRPHTTAAHAYRAYAATAAYANKHFMGSGSWSNLR